MGRIELRDRVRNSVTNDVGVVVSITEKETDVAKAKGRIVARWHKGGGDFRAWGEVRLLDARNRLAAYGVCGQAQPIMGTKVVWRRAANRLAAATGLPVIVED